MGGWRFKSSLAISTLGNQPRRVCLLLMNRRSFIAFFCERCPDWCIPKWWHAHAYFDYWHCSRVMVIWPFHWAVQFVWWLNWKWSEHRQKPSWIDRHTLEAIKKSRET